MTQISLFDTVKDDDIIDELRSIDIGNMTPLDALNKLYQLFYLLFPDLIWQYLAF